VGQSLRPADLARVTEQLSKAWQDQTGFAEGIGILESPAESAIDRTQMRFGG
jgi:hypothetical protein